ncbi:hypothetical protein VKT23_015331 [Stygiomarasmius scandens]|uniref:Uncharacterized protein n=1 Tax=Marasmiellus scandens TaxID=2682957 RepID=A0ABR1J2K8_9AGAR
MFSRVGLWQICLITQLGISSVKASIAIDSLTTAIAGQEITLHWSRLNEDKAPSSWHVEIHTATDSSIPPSSILVSEPGQSNGVIVVEVPFEPEVIGEFTLLGIADDSGWVQMYISENQF